MILILNKIYQYVFNDWADIEKAIKKDLDESIKTTIRIKKKAEIKKFFFEAADEKSHPLIADHNKAQFRAVLRALKSTHLEQVLFDNVTDELKESYSFPDDKQIEAYFDEQEKAFHYFSQNKEDTAIAISRFKKYFKVCKLVGDLIEQNNGADNSAASQHAYKLLVVFGNKPANDFQPIDEYLNTYNFYKHNAPLHDALINSIPKYEDKALHLPEWRKLIQQSGPRGFQLFDLAVAVEKQLQKAPANYAEALEAAKKMTYKNADHYPELADLCFQYRRSEEIFEKCLAVEKKRKMKDNLPMLSVNGADVEKPDYHLVKLPIHDPRAYLLGHITNCCQSIGGHSEECVIDGVTRENNGFYVLLRAKKTNVQTKPVDEKGNIDYQSFDIVGQGYAWITEQHNLTFDSWENLTPSRDDEVIAKMLKQFGKQLTHANGSPFLRVTIGTGGKTPDILENNITTPEVMREGTMYGDASQQSEIYCNEEKRSSLLAGFELDDYFASMIDDLYRFANLRKMIQSLKTWIINSCYSAEFIAKTKEMLTTKEMNVFINYLLNAESRFKTLSEKPWGRVVSLHMAGIFTKLNELKLENELEVTQLILLNEKSAEVNLKAFSILEIYKLNDNKALIINVLRKPHFAEEICKSYLKLNELKLENAAEIWQVILDNIKCSEVIVDSFSLVVKLNMQNDKELRKAILSHPNYALVVCENITNGLAKLAHLKLENDAEVRAAVYAYPFDTLKICNALTLLAKFHLEKYSPARDNIFGHTGIVKYDYLKGVFTELEKLNEMKLEQPRKNVLAKSIVDFNYDTSQTILPLYSKLCEHKLEHIPELFTSLFTLFPKDEYINAYVKLCELKLENDPDYRQCILTACHTPGYVIERYSPAIFVEALSLIKQQGWEGDMELRQFICTRPCDAVDMVNSFIQLKSLNLEEMKDVRQYAFKNPNTVPDLIEWVKLLKELKLEHDFELRQLVFKKFDTAFDLLFHFEQLIKLNLEKDPQIRQRVFDLFTKGKYNCNRSLIETLTVLKDYHITIDENIKNQILTVDYPKFIIFDLIKAASVHPIKLFDVAQPRPSKIVIKQHVKHFSEQYEKGKKIIESFAKRHPEAIKAIAEQIYYFDRDRKKYSQIKNIDIFSNECFVILVGQNKINFSKLVAMCDKKESGFVGRLSLVNIFTEQGIELLNKKYLTFEELLDKKVNSHAWLSHFIHSGGIVLCEQSRFRVKDYLKLKLEDQYDIRDILLREKGKLAVKYKLTNVYAFLKIPSKQRQEYIGKLEIKPTMEMHTASDFDLDPPPANDARMCSVGCIIS